MSDTPIKDALDKLGNGGEGFELLVNADKTNTAVGASATKELGKGWSVAAAVQWTKDQWSALGKVVWKPR